MLSVVMTTYVPHAKSERLTYLRETLAALRSHPGLRGGPIHLLLADDGSPPEVSEAIRELAERWPWYSSVISGPHGGIGASLNRAMLSVGRDDLWMYTTDDWLLTAPLDLEQAVRIIQEENYDYVRLGPPHPNVTCTTQFKQGLGWWLRLLPAYGGFAFATRPFLASRRFYDLMGPFKEQCDAYECERDYAIRDPLAHMKLGQVVPHSLAGPWQHIGEEEVGDTYVA